MHIFYVLLLVTTSVFAITPSDECDYPRERDLSELSPNELQTDYCKAETMAAANMFVSVTLELNQMKSSARYRKKLSNQCGDYAETIRKYMGKNHGTEPQCPAQDLSCITP